MRKRQFQLSGEEVAALRQAEQDSRDVHERRRLQALRLYGTGQAMTTIREVVGCSERSVRQWAAQYRAEGLAGMRSGWRGGNANKLSVEQRAEVAQRLQNQRPHELLTVDAHTSAGQFWSVATLREALRLWYGLSWAHDDSYRHILRACGLSPQRVQGQYRSRANATRIAEFEAGLKKTS